VPEQRGLQRVRTRLIRDDVLASLRAAILEGTFQAGERLIETELAEQLGTSRSPVRDALVELAREGLVALHTYRGAVVATFSDEDVREIYTLRVLLEGYATRLATENATAQDMECLQRIHEELRNIVEHGDVASLVLKDFEFHHEICRLSGNRRLLDVWSTLASQTRLVMTLADEVYFEPSFILEIHSPILEALHNRDPDAAEMAVRFHLGEVAELIVEKMASKDVHPSHTANER
jgi:DNA-binding GntR family transcriptional regulator